MNQDVQRWQDDGWRAFNWIEHMYGQSKTAWDDAQAAFEDAGWTYQFGNGFGGAAYTTNLHEWPFVYLKAFVALPPGVSCATVGLHVNLIRQARVGTTLTAEGHLVTRDDRAQGLPQGVVVQRPGQVPRHGDVVLHATRL